MSKFLVDLSEENSGEADKNLPSAGNSSSPKKRGGCLKILAILGICSFIILIIGAIGGYFYWQSVKKTPQYSLALIVDSARRDDKERVAELIDTEEVVNYFTPQIAKQAVELYGKNLPPTIIEKVSLLIIPLMPAIKEKAKAELPQLIREKTEKFADVPYWMIALGADRALKIEIEGDTAKITSKIPDKPLELTMKREKDLWKIVAVKDEKLSKKIAEKIGQQLMALVAKGNVKQAGDILGVDNLGNILKNLNDIFK